MNRVGSLVFSLILAIGLVPLSAVPISVDAADPTVYRGVINYRMRGPAAAPYGIGSALLVGAAAPVAVARIQNILRNVVDLVGQLPAVQDQPAMQTVREWMDQGIPVNLAEDLPVAGAYEATVAFALTQADDGTFQLQSGTVRWRTSNTLHISDGEVSLRDDFAGSGTHTLDPATDRISLRIDRGANPPSGELDVEISHPEPVDGASVFGGLGGTFEITIEGRGGEMVMDGSALDVPLSAAGMPTPVTIVEAPGMDRTISYQRRAPLDEMNYTVEMWSDAFDDEVLVEYELRTDCTALITTSEPDTVLTYNDSDPGVMEFKVEAGVEPGSLGTLLDELVWTFPEIPGSVLTTDPEDGRGREVTAHYETLPAKNTDFGEKTIRAHFDPPGLCEDPQPLRVRVFFPRDASNNPGGEFPNWFYYWKQTRASQGHGDSILYDPTDKENLGYYLGYYSSEEANHIYLTDLGPDFVSSNILTGKRTEGIDVFASVILHEWTHLENHQDWWPNGYRAAGDSDGDRVPDGREAGYGLDPHSRDTFGIGMRDSEVPAYLQENTWPSGSANSVDWANPGKQSGGSQ